MRQININRQLMGLEDLTFGVGTETQTRAGQSVVVTKINAANLPFDETQSLLDWAKSTDLPKLNAMSDELIAIYNNLTMLGNVEGNLVMLNAVEDSLTMLNSIYTNISKIQNLDTNMARIQNIDTYMPELSTIYTNLAMLQAVYNNLTMLNNVEDNLVAINSVNSNLTQLLAIYTQVIPNLTELLQVNENAAQVAADKITVNTDKLIVAQDKEDVSAMKVAVESIYDTFDDRFLGVKTNDPTLDNDGNALLGGAMYFNTSSNALKVYSLANTTWYTIPQIYLSGLLDVTLTSITTGDILTWNGTKWVNTRTPSFDSVKLNGGTSTAGTATWNNTELTYDLVLNDNVTLQVGQEEVVYCKNNTLTTIPNGKPVMAVGTNGNSGNILIALHDGTKASAKRLIGVTTQAILPSNNVNPYGFVTRNGKVRGLNTTGSDYGETWLDGDILYVKATGALTKVEPLDTELKMPIAFVIHAHTNGTLYVRTTGIDENHDRDFINDLADVHSKTAKTTPVDADEIMIADSASAWSLKKITWANIKATLLNLFVSKDANGNVGVGCIPNAWFGSYTRVIELGKSSDGGTIWSSLHQNVSHIGIGANFYYGSNFAPKYKANGPANDYNQQNGCHFWRTAPSGTAGNVITWTDAMSLDANSTLLVGSNASAGKKNIIIAPSEFLIQATEANVAYRALKLNPSGGNLLVGTTTDNGIDKLQVNGSTSSGTVRFVSDLNTITGNSTFLTGDFGFNNATNAPCLYGTVHQAARATDECTQMVINILNGELYTRVRNNGGWTAWVEK